MQPMSNGFRNDLQRSQVTNKFVSAGTCQQWGLVTGSASTASHQVGFEPLDLDDLFAN